MYRYEVRETCNRSTGAGSSSTVNHHIVLVRVGSPTFSSSDLALSWTDLKPNAEVSSGSLVKYSKADLMKSEPPQRLHMSGLGRRGLSVFARQEVCDLRLR